MSSIIYKVGRRLRSYYRRSYYYTSGLYFDYVLKTYRTDGLSWVVPRELTSRISRGYYAQGDIEQDEQQLVKKHLSPRATVLELGANIGIVSSVINQRLIYPHHHVAVEANPEVIPYLETNKTNNRCSFRVENCVIAEAREVTFFFGNTISSGGLAPTNSDGSQQSVSVPRVTLADMQKKHNLTFDTLIMDIEGAEYSLLKEIEEQLDQFELLIFEQHPRILSHKQLTEIEALLRRYGSLVDQRGDTVVWRRNQERITH